MLEDDRMGPHLKQVGYFREPPWHCTDTHSTFGLSFHYAVPDMNYFKNTIILLIALAASVHAHMRLYYPPPFAASNNPHRTGPPDERLDYPYNCCGRKTVYPCRGYLDLLGTDQGKPVATWPAGSVQNFSLVGGGTHYGGSCQVGFSIDKGKTWQVVSSYEGNCPHRKGGNNAPEEQTFQFKVPSDMPSGDHVFAWTWVNREQEFNMVCSSVTISDSLEPPVPGYASDGFCGSSSATARADPSANATLSASPVEQGTPATPSTAGTLDAEKPFDGNGQGSTLRSPRRALDRHRGRARRVGTGQITDRGITHPAYMARPGFLLANIGNGCKTPKETAEVKYPNPGLDVVAGDEEYPLALPEPADKCGAYIFRKATP
nr:hypothetical protein CPAG_08635 [Coccidioides posadasii RMSCC 3488]